ncbi:aminopeptidase P family protein [Segatella buccae]|uniref:aminopeptidase P family protein n=1 Tax=Segatella buccae TaxID=28126 RepID=UPI00248F18BC|nr:aminopeptidase P family protein [Segatella buccae]
MKEDIEKRLTSLRDVMRRERLAAFIFPSTDAHQSEYVPDHWKGREWISGFNGSAGTAVVTMEAAALWTDSRYFLAAEKQLEGTEFQLMKLRVAGTPTIAQWLGGQLADSDSKEVGIDGKVVSVAYARQLVDELRGEGGLTLRTNFDPLAVVWTDRPSLPYNNKVEIQPVELAGGSAEKKLALIRKALRGLHTDGMLMSALDDVAWTLNLRGRDVHCNPVFLSYLLIAPERATLFIDRRKLTPEVERYLSSVGVGVEEYAAVGKGLKDYFSYNILMDPKETGEVMPGYVDKHVKVVYANSPVPAMKAVKTDAEIKGFKAAMLRDGVAMVKFLRWLQPAVEAGGQTEMSVDRKLTELRAEQKRFRDISFDTIAGYGPHGAIVHYEASPETDVELRPEGFLLLDSGAQYQDGTTDITRTIPLGPLTDEQCRIYTLVLKGHIRLAMAKFPDGACGTQLDALAREPMWREGLNYLHGTGHGVGSYLNVHEGPHQIRMEYMPAPLRAGMTVTDEPGLYLQGKFGVRIENTMLVIHYTKGEFGDFLQLAPLTLCPISTTPIVLSMMTQEELDWMNDYHRMVYDRLSPLLDENERQWLADATAAV